MMSGATCHYTGSEWHSCEWKSKVVLVGNEFKVPLVKKRKGIRLR